MFSLYSKKIFKVFLKSLVISLYIKWIYRLIVICRSPTENVQPLHTDKSFLSKTKPLSLSPFPSSLAVQTFLHICYTTGSQRKDLHLCLTCFKILPWEIYVYCINNSLFFIYIVTYGQPRTQKIESIYTAYIF